MFLSTSSVDSGLWKLDKMTKTFTNILATGRYNTFQIIGNHSLIITSTFSNSTGIITYHNGITTHHNYDNYGLSVFKILDDTVALLCTTTSSRPGLYGYKEGVIEEIAGGYSWETATLGEDTFIWAGGTGLSTSYGGDGIYRYNTNPSWGHTVSLLERVYDYGWGYKTYIDEVENLIMFGNGVTYVPVGAGGILVWESGVMANRYSGTLQASLGGIIKYSSNTYIIPSSYGSAPLRYDRDINAISVITGVTDLTKATLLPNNYVIFVGNYNGYVVYDVINKSTTVTYLGATGWSFSGKVYLFDTYAIVYHGTSSSVSYKRLWEIDYATMTPVDLITTHSLTFEQSDNFNFGLTIKSRIYSGTKIYDTLAHTYSGSWSAYFN